jgi:hypothetical protein
MFEVNMTALESSNRLLSVADSGSPNLPKFMGTGRQIPETCLQLAYNSPTTRLQLAYNWTYLRAENQCSAR